LSAFLKPARKLSTLVFQAATALLVKLKPAILVLELKLATVSGSKSLSFVCLLTSTSTALNHLYFPPLNAFLIFSILAAVAALSAPVISFTSTLPSPSVTGVTDVPRLAIVIPFALAFNISSTLSNPPSFQIFSSERSLW